MDHSREDRNDSYSRSTHRFLPYRFPPRRRFDSISRTRFPSILSSASSFLPNPFPPWLMTSFHPGPSIDVSPTFEAFLGFWEGSQHFSSSNPLPPFLRYVRSLLPSLFPNRSHSIGPMEPRERDELPSSFLSPRFDPNAKRKRWERTRGNGSPGGSDVDPSPAPPPLPRGLVPCRSSMSEPHAEGDPIGPESSDGRRS